MKGKFCSWGFKEATVTDRSGLAIALKNLKPIAEGLVGVRVHDVRQDRRSSENSGGAGLSVALKVIKGSCWLWKDTVTSLRHTTQVWYEQIVLVLYSNSCVLTVLMFVLHLASRQIKSITIINIRAYDMMIFGKTQQECYEGENGRFGEECNK